MSKVVIRTPFAWNNCLKITARVIHQKVVGNVVKVTSRRRFTKKYGEQPLRRVTHCIFDLDGTILDTERMYHEVVGELCNKYGKKYTKELAKEMIGLTDHDVSQRLVKELLLPISASFFERELESACRKSLPFAPLRQGVEKLLTHLHKYKVPLALATNSTEPILRLHMMMRPKLFCLFHHKVCSSDSEVSRPKPFPDILLLTAARFAGKPKPTKCLVFEDSPTGVDAAVAAGMPVVMIPSLPGVDSKYRRKSTLFLNSLTEFKPQSFGLPAYLSVKSRN
ncbi:probable pseudouridine-5'-phosphatase [Hyposmocoma kahamanoa]|uniref:probable pseudouridine-5'-phosphatase n=1 Tax=Hyposmocoma kahamanoa TaxID=1477025 RepID=UPI000E6D813C|nr:probable pseudouridine-5'-phosphatase [Hyposmocoma kahamanoa]